MFESDKTASGTIVGVDVGGTFTDLIALTPDQKLYLAKVPSTLIDQAAGVMNALTAAQCDIAALDLIVHGTTTTTNAVLERKLARTGLITTQGFRDILELGRRTRPQPYGMVGQFTPLIPRDLRNEVSERMDCDGNILTSLDLAAVERAAEALLAKGCETVVVHFLHSYANPQHELAAEAVLRRIWPNDYITTGHKLLSENREFERGVTAAVNASVQPILDRYISRLSQTLVDQGYTGNLLVMNGNGGMTKAANVAREAAKTVMSGPASGVMAAAFTGRVADAPNLITYDMGGTSTDVALIRDAVPSVSNEIEIEYGMPIHVPMVDVRTVGAGGGSIVRINAGGLLEVGPESAGATPGPICYGKGGTRPTISDANFLLGRLSPSGFADGNTSSILTQVHNIFERELAAPLGCSVIDAAEAVVKVANTKMAGAIRMVSLSIGADPRDFALFAFGGAGPLHAADLAEELDIPRVLIPARPGLTNALGCIVADLRHDFVQTINTPLSQLAPSQILDIITNQENRGRALIAKESIALTGVEVQLSLDMQFVGQTHILNVPIDRENISSDKLQSLFEAAYQTRFHVQLDQIQASVVNVNCSVIGHRPPLDLQALAGKPKRSAKLKNAQSSQKNVFFEGMWHDAPVYERTLLPSSFTIEGPAIIAQMDTTTLIRPEDRVAPDDVGNLIIEIGGAP